MPVLDNSTRDGVGTLLTESDRCPLKMELDEVDTGSSSNCMAAALPGAATSPKKDKQNGNDDDVGTTAPSNFLEHPLGVTGLINKAPSSAAGAAANEPLSDPSLKAEPEIRHKEGGRSSAGTPLVAALQGMTTLVPEEKEANNKDAMTEGEEVLLDDLPIQRDESSAVPRAETLRGRTPPLQERGGWRL